VVTYSPLTTTARFNSRFTLKADTGHYMTLQLSLHLSLQLSSFRVSMKCVAISKQWVTAIEDCEGNCRHCDAPCSHVSSAPSITGPAGFSLRKQEMSTCPMIRKDQGGLYLFLPIELDYGDVGEKIQRRLTTNKNIIDP